MIEKMQKIRVIAPKEKLDQIFQTIAQLECVDFHELSKTPLDKNADIEFLQNDINIAESLLSFASKDKKSSASAEVFFNLGKDKLKELESLKREKDAAIKKINEIEPIKLLNFEKSQSEAIKLLAVSLLSGDAKAHQNFQDNFQHDLVYQFAGNIGQNKKIFLYIFPKNSSEKLSKKIRDLKLQVIALPDKSPKEEFLQLSRSLKEIKNKIKKTRTELNEMSPDKKTFLKYLFELRWKLKTAELCSKTNKTEKFSVFEGWSLANRFNQLKNELQAISNYIIIEKMPFSPEEAPVALNNKIAKSFEMVTKLYGMPKPTEVDPTPLLAPFFIVFFGFALSDAGYGAALTVIGAVLLYLSKKLEFLKNIGIFSLLMGISTVIFGYALGTFFGINLSAVIDPQLQPMTVLSVCFALGLLQIIFGLGISFVHKLRNGARLIELINESGFWILSLFSFLFLIIQDIFKFSFIKLDFLLQFIGVLLIINLLSHVIFSPKKLAGLMKGLGGLYGGVNFLADTLSYSRLFALGLATGVVAYTVNLVAGILKEMISVPILSEIIFLAVLIGGHLFNIAINVLGAFIHSSRLQFVEFFSKFLEGGGRQFNPLKYKQ